MNSLKIAAIGWLITVVGWLVSALVSKAVNALLEARANCIDQRLQLDAHALLTTAHGLCTNNGFLKKMVQKLEQLTYEAENLLDEMDYYRLEHEIQKKAASSTSCFRCTYHFIISLLNVSGHVKRFNLSRRMKKLDKQLQKSVEAEAASSSSCFRRTYHFIMSLLNVSGRVKRFNLSRRMKKLDKQLQKSVEAVRNAVGIEDVMTIQTTERSQTEATKLRETTSFEPEPKIFGRIQERDELVNLLKNEKREIVGKVPIVAIVGSGGVGKTTLARLVYHDPEVRKYFQDNRFWICVSNRFDINRLTREMLEVVNGNRYEQFSNLDKLQGKHKDGLVSKRFLLVLDDMWEYKNRSQWDLMVAPLKKCMVKGSIILVTSRHKSVAEMVEARNIVPLKGLKKGELLSFLSTCIFHDENYGGNGMLRIILEKIADKLKGNPLAAKTVAAMLVDKPRDVKSWIKIMDNEEWIYQSGPDDIMPALEVSYKHMPIHLQRCFSYCAMLPEDHTFTCEELVYLWMAQGLLNVRPEVKTMEDIGSDYFNDLLNRGFFQSEDGGLLCYTFHENLLHRFARMVSIEECLRINDTEQIRKILPTIRHLSIFNCTKRSGEEIGNALADLKRKNLSTIVNWDMLPSDTFQCIYDMVKETQFLRAMRITLCSQVQPTNLNFQNFVSLRYLRLIMPDSNTSNTSNTLPKEICRLYHLEVFEIEGKLQELPNNFSNLVSLRHFIVEGELHSEICGVGKLTSLQELNHFDAQQKIGFEIEQLGPLKEIGGSLHIRNLENVESKEEASKARLAKKENLDVLYLKWNLGEQETESVLEGLRPNTNLKSLTIDGYGGVVSPTWLDSSLIFLESLTLKGCKAWEQLPPIGELECLKHLELSGMAVREIGPQCYGTHQCMKFRSLEVFEITHMPDLEKLVWSDQLQLSLCFKKLKKLRVVDCPKLVDPLSGSAKSFSERFPSLNSLKIEDCPLIFQLPPLPYSSLLSSISIATTGFIKYMDYKVNSDSGITPKCCLNLDQSSSLKVDEILSLHVFSSLHVLEISCISSLESFDLHSFVALETLVIKECQSLTSLTFGEHLVRLRSLSIISCETLTTINGLRSWVNLEWLHFQECPGFIAAWDSASREIERTEPDFSFSLKSIYCDSLALLTLPIRKQLTSLQAFLLEVSCFSEGNVDSLQLLNSIDLVDIEGRKNLQSFPFDLFPSLKHLTIKFPHIDSLPTSSDTEISEEFSKLTHIKGIYIGESPVMIYFKLSSEEMIWQQMDPNSVYTIKSNQRNDVDGFQVPLFWNQNYRRIYQSI